jgi:hypothetical protein
VIGFDREAEGSDRLAAFFQFLYETAFLFAGSLVIGLLIVLFMILWDERQS